MRSFRRSMVVAAAAGGEAGDSISNGESRGHKTLTRSRHRQRQSQERRHDEDDHADDRYSIVTRQKTPTTTDRIRDSKANQVRKSREKKEQVLPYRVSQHQQQQSYPSPHSAPTMTTANNSGCSKSQPQNLHDGGALRSESRSRRSSLGDSADSAETIYHEQKRTQCNRTGSTGQQPRHTSHINRTQQSGTSFSTSVPSSRQASRQKHMRSIDPKVSSSDGSSKRNGMHRHHSQQTQSITTGRRPRRTPEMVPSKSHRPLTVTTTAKVARRPVPADLPQCPTFASHSAVKHHPISDDNDGDDNRIANQKTSQLISQNRPSEIRDPSPSLLRRNS